MGKHKVKHSDKSSSDDQTTSSSEDDRRENKSHSAKKRKREEKKKKTKHKKKHKNDSDKDLVKAAKKFLKKQLASQATGDAKKDANEDGEKHIHEPIPVKDPITEDDYFLKHAEFTAWLKDSKHMYFNELTAEESRLQFKDFVDKWNQGRLPASYYSGVLSAPASRTSYKWKFAGEAGASHERGTLGMSAYLEDAEMRRQQDRQDSRTLLKADQKRWNAEQRLTLDEMLPKATGREALVEKKMARREAARAREESPDAVPLPGGGRDIMGGGDSFEAAKAREAKRQDMRQQRSLAKAEELQHRVSQYQAAEDAKMAQFRALLGAGPISIPKREPPPPA